MSGEGEGDDGDVQPPPRKKLRGAGSSGNGGGELEAQEDESSPCSAQERDVGITEFVSSHEGFFAILKRRSGTSFPICVCSNKTLPSPLYMTNTRQKTFCVFC